MSDEVVSSQVNVPQGRFLRLPQRFKAFVSGYRSGKTYVGCIRLCTNAWERPGVPQGYFAPTYPHIRDIFYPTIELVSGTLGLNVNINVGNKEVFLRSGGQVRSIVRCRSLSTPSSIIGFEIGHALVDELDVLPADKAALCWNKILARMSNTDAENTVDVTTTPEGFLFTYDRFLKKVSENPALGDRYGLVQASTYDNEANLPPDYIPSLLETYPAEMAEAYLHGQFVNLKSGTVYYAFDRKVHGSTEVIREKEPLFIGVDFNVSHMAATVYVQRPNGWHAVAEIKDMFDTPDVIRVISEKWSENGHRVIVYPDTSGGNRNTANAAISDIALLKGAGFSVRARASNPHVRDRVMAVNKCFQDSRLWVNTRECPTVAECLEQQSYDASGSPDKKTGFDHQNDASGYPIAYEFPIVSRNAEPVAFMDR
jgi:hypothetical protein